MYTPEELYDRIVQARQRYGLSPAAAVERVARDLETEAPRVWREVGVWCLTQVDRVYFRSKGYVGVQSVRVTQEYPDADDSLSNETGDHGTSDAQVRPVPSLVAADAVAVRTEARGCVTPMIELPPSPPRQAPEEPLARHSLCDDQHSTARESATAHPGDHTRHVAQPIVVPAGVPWPLRNKVNWNFDMEFSLPGVGRKPLGRFTGKDFARAATILRRTGETTLQNAANADRLAKILGDDALGAAWARGATVELNMALKRMLPAPQSA